MGFLDDVNKQSEQYGSGGVNKGFFKFEKNGLYRMRILVKPTVIATHFFGKGTSAVVCVGIDKGCKYHGVDPTNIKGEDYGRPSVKLCTYIIDRNDGNMVKLAELPYSIGFSINDLQKDEDFTFEDFPMPYDIKVMYDGDSKDPKGIYRTQPSPTRVPLTAEEQAALDDAMKKTTPEQYVDKRKAKQVEKSNPAPASSGIVEYPDGPNPDDIPF